MPRTTFVAESDLEGLSVFLNVGVRSLLTNVMYPEQWDSEKAVCHCRKTEDKESGRTLIPAAEAWAHREMASNAVIENDQSH